MAIVWQEFAIYRKLHMKSTSSFVDADKNDFWQIPAKLLPLANGKLLANVKPQMEIE